MTLHSGSTNFATVAPEAPSTSGGVQQQHHPMFGDITLTSPQTMTRSGRTVKQVVPTQQDEDEEFEETYSE